MKLPAGEAAIVEMPKLRDYCLNPLHPRGRHKARVFVSALGIMRGDAEFLGTELLRAARDGEASKGTVDQFGERYTVDFTLVCRHRQALVRSSWIVRTGERIPRLTSCFVILKGGLP